MNHYVYLAIGVLVVLGLVSLFFMEIMSTENTVRQLLEEHEIPYKDWDETGTLNKLVMSVEDGEVTLESKNSGLIVFEEIAVVTFYYRDGQHLLELREYHQVGDEAPKPRAFNGSVGVRVRTRYESPLQALQRKIAQELGSSNAEFRDPENYKLEECGEETLDPQVSDDIHPSMIRVCHRRHFTCIIDHKLYQRVYIEKRRDAKAVYFRWIKTEKPQDPLRKTLIPA